MPDILLDGNFLEPTPVGPRRFKYPFRKNGDANSNCFEETNWQQRATHLQPPFPIRHLELPDYYLVWESDPEELGIADILIFTRRWCRVPARQTVPGSIYVTKPAIPGTFPQFYGSFLMRQPDESVPSYQKFTSQTLDSDSGPSTGQLTAGTFTLTYNSQTTAPLAFDATSGAIQTAINALSSISSGDGVSVTGSIAAGLTIQFNAHAMPTADTSSLTASGAGPFTQSNNSYLYGRTGVQIHLSIPAAQTITGGTFTLTFFGETTAAIAYNATPATVQTAINALAGVTARGGVVVYPSTGSSTILPFANYIFFRVEFNPFLPFTATTTLLVPVGSTAVVTPTYISTPNDAAQVSMKAKQLIAFTAGTLTARLFGKTGHGLTTGDTLFVRIGGEYFFLDPGEFTVPDANTISITSALNDDAFIAAGFADQIGKMTGTYAAGLQLTRCNRVTDFYLPGVTPGIVTADDIPLPAYQGDPATLLAAIFAGTPLINFEVGELAQWEDTPILARTITQLNASTL